MENHHHHLTHPLLPTTTTTITATSVIDFTSTASTFVDVTPDDNDDNTKFISSNSKILLRLFSVALVGLLCVWANHEASKVFEIDIENGAAIDSVVSRRFQLIAARLVLSTSKFVETILYPYSSNINVPYKKKVNRVTLRLADRNLTPTVTVDSFKEHEFVVNLSPSILELETNFEYAMLRAVQQGMARVWIYNNNAPKTLVNGMVEYISRLAGLGEGVHIHRAGPGFDTTNLGTMSDFSGGSYSPESGKTCWMDEDPVAVAHFLSYGEEERRGFIQRLNLAMKGRWQDRTVDDVLGMPARYLCGSHVSQSIPL
ncbi:hypothetical protein Vadar_017089 [Vaccinium darrowii]|uniref:Uncharacterized protein n=1 Tax=Vaccinium darrowii TaxID=229202 RepID=A0ACB7Z487_9ERIC|nr:hypothetical protein Vadar_017089 [Vaccinium darrowii]